MIRVVPEHGSVGCADGGQVGDVDRNRVRKINLLFRLAKHRRATRAVLQSMRSTVLRNSPLGFGWLVKRKLTAAEIPIQSRMMTVSDIYDALTSNDRPYKRAISTEP